MRPARRTRWTAKPAEIGAPKKLGKKFREGVTRTGSAALNGVGVFMAAEENELGEALALAQKGDQAAFRVIYRAQQPALLRYLTVLVGAEAEDVASEAWLQIVRDLGTFAGDWDGFRGWAATIARHRAMDHLRRTRRRPVAADAPMETLLMDLPAEQDTAEQAISQVATDNAVKLIASLPRDQAEAVMLRAVVGLDAEAAGKLLGKRAGAVRTAAYRGLRKLATVLSGQKDGGLKDGGQKENSQKENGKGVTPLGTTALKGVR